MCRLSETGKGVELGVPKAELHLNILDFLGIWVPVQVWLLLVDMGQHELGESVGSLS